MNKNNSNSKNRELAYNGIGSGGGGSGRVNLKSFEYVSDGTVGASIAIPDDAHFILGIRSIKGNGDEVSYSGFPVVDGIGSAAGAYNANASAGLTIGFTISNFSMVINFGVDAGARLYDNGQISTFYYI